MAESHGQRPGATRANVVKPGPRREMASFADWRESMAATPAALGDSHDWQRESAGLLGQGRTAGANVRLPQMDVTKREGQLLMRAALPGVQPHEMSISVRDGVLTLEGGLGGAAFRREIALPDGIETESITARFAHGVLEVSMPMPRPSQLPVSRIRLTPRPTGAARDVH